MTDADHLRVLRERVKRLAWILGLPEGKPQGWDIPTDAEEYAALTAAIARWERLDTLPKEIKKLPRLLCAKTFAMPHPEGRYLDRTAVLSLLSPGKEETNNGA